MTYPRINAYENRFQPCQALHYVAFQSVGDSGTNRECDQRRKLM